MNSTNRARAATAAMLFAATVLPATAQTAQQMDYKCVETETKTFPDQTTSDVRNVEYQVNLATAKWCAVGDATFLPIVGECYTIHPPTDNSATPDERFSVFKVTSIVGDWLIILDAPATGPGTHASKAALNLRTGQVVADSDMSGNGKYTVSGNCQIVPFTGDF